MLDISFFHFNHHPCEYNEIKLLIPGWADSKIYIKSLYNAPISAKMFKMPIFHASVRIHHAESDTYNVA